MARTRAIATPFGERLLAAMAHSGLTQQQIADKVGISQSTLGEAYRHDASKHTVQIAMACGVQPVWLATGQGEMLDDFQAMSPEVRRMAEVVDALPPGQKKWLLGVIQLSLEAVGKTSSNGLGQTPNNAVSETKSRKSA